MMLVNPTYNFISTGNATPLTRAGFASIRIVTHRVHSGPGFFQAWIVPRCTTVSPGLSSRISDPSSMTRISFPHTATQKMSSVGARG